MDLELDEGGVGEAAQATVGVQPTAMPPGCSPRGDSAQHTIAVCQARGPGRVHYLCKLAEGKTPAEARRALKRRLATVFRT